MCVPDKIVAENRPAAGHCSGGPCTGKCRRIALPQPAPAGDILDDLPIEISEGFATDILRPYRKSAVYLKSAEIIQFHDKAAAGGIAGQSRLVTASGRFAIPESCYIDDTGHFNAVEFNICFNQLAYVSFAKCCEAGLMGRLRQEKVNVPTMMEFKRDQLPAMVIVSIESRYYKQLDSTNFTGELSINKISSIGPAWFFSTSVSFADAEGVKAKGSVMLAYSPTFTPVRH